MNDDAESVCAMELQICNRRGLHARASAKFVACADRFDAEVTVKKDELTVTGNSIMGLMMLGAANGSFICLNATGPQAAEAIEALSELVRERFGEEE